MSSFLHDLSNLISIVHGKVRQANQLLKACEEKGKIDPVLAKLGAALEEIERLEDLLIAEKNLREKSGGDL